MVFVALAQDSSAARNHESPRPPGLKVAEQEVRTGVDDTQGESAHDVEESCHDAEAKTAQNSNKEGSHTDGCANCADNVDCCLISCWMAVPSQGVLLKDQTRQLIFHVVKPLAAENTSSALLSGEDCSIESCIRPSEGRLFSLNSALLL